MSQKKCHFNYCFLTSLSIIYESRYAEKCSYNLRILAMILNILALAKKKKKKGDHKVSVNGMHLNTRALSKWWICWKYLVRNVAILLSTWQTKSTLWSHKIGEHHSLLKRIFWGMKWLQIDKQIFNSTVRLRFHDSLSSTSLL